MDFMKIQWKSLAGSGKKAQIFFENQIDSTRSWIWKTVRVLLNSKEIVGGE